MNGDKKYVRYFSISLRFTSTNQFATFGVRSNSGIIDDAAPIARWCLGKTLDYVMAYYRKRGAIITEIDL